MVSASETNVQIAPAGDRQTYVGKGFQVAAHPAFDATDAPGDGAQLTNVRRMERDDAVGLAKRHVLQHDALSLVCPWPGYLDLLDATSPLCTSTPAPPWISVGFRVALAAFQPC